MNARTSQPTMPALFLALCLATLPAKAAVWQLTNYDAVNGNPGITTLGFESGSTGFSTPPDISIVYPSGGIAAFYGDGYLQAFASAGIPPEKFGAQHLGNVSSFPRHTDITATFPGTVNLVGAWVHWTPIVETIEFSAYGPGDELLFSTSLQVPADFTQLYYFGILSDQPIARAVWHPVEDYFFALDNLTYGVAASPVPLPAAAWLFGGSIVALGMFRRRIAATTPSADPNSQAAAGTGTTVLIGALAMVTALKASPEL
jgi:hypothetical protein